ncbi:MAG: ankyrin repeat domain-containing protein [Candidatus Riflebacteria bacterium]|nr:ankyrin repeat domain-containing protein [Candidatus Riflebacteria bacterium]
MAKSRKNQVPFMFVIIRNMMVILWILLCTSPAIWQIMTSDSCYRRYSMWRASTKIVGDSSLPFYDLLHKLRYPAHNAVIRNSMAILAGIPKDQLKPDRLDNFAMTPLAYAARYGLEEALHYLLANGSSPNISVYSGTTALLLAVEHGHAKLAMMLLESGADATMANAAGVTCVHLAARNNFDQLLAKIAELEQSLNGKDSAGLSPLDYAIEMNAKKAIIQLAASGAECSFLKTPKEDNIAVFLKRWQESGTSPFSVPILAETEDSRYEPLSDAKIPAELPVNVKPHTFRNRGE